MSYFGLWKPDAYRLEREETLMFTQEEQAQVRFSAADIPFSRYGAYISVSDKGDRLIIHNVRRRFGEDAVYELRLLRDGQPVAYTAYSTPRGVYVSVPGGGVTLWVRDDETLGVEARGVTLWFSQLGRRGYGVQEGERAYKLIAVGLRLYTLFYVQEGAAALFNPGGADALFVEEGHAVGARNSGEHRDIRLCAASAEGRVLAAVRMANTEPREVTLPIDPEGEMLAAGEEFGAFAAACRAGSGRASEDAFMAVTRYNLWSSFVRAGDCYHYDTMLMSKNFMSSVWSWDHCFNALAMAALGQERALEQFYAPFVLQAPTGALPDMWNPNSEVVWGVTKPPIHGWCFGKLMDRFDFDAPVLERVYGYLQKWTDWWLTYRDSDGDGVPEYPMGCDSGWDNATVFDVGYFVESPDLSAFLVLQMRTLARIARALGREADGGAWDERADMLKAKLYAHSWTAAGFVAKQSRTHVFDPAPTSLLTLVPIVLGEELDADKAALIAGKLEREHLTPYGLATERPDSPKYAADGYWRGPIWAPSTYLIADGLRRAGYADLAAEIGRRYIALSRDAAGGHFENFDALTGKGLRAPGYTWSASVYALLAEEQKEREP